MNARATLPLSVVFITKDAANQLGEALRTLPACAEVLVVDTGSQDGTPTLASQHGARVLTTPWLGFGPTKQWAITQARYDWVLCLDADERLSPALQASLQALFAAGAPPQSAYRFARTNRFMGRYLRHGEGYPDWSLRLFDRRQARWSDDWVHEKVLARSPPATLAGDLLHHSAESLSDYLAKQNRYSSLAADAALAQGRRAHTAQLLLSPLLRFIKFYLLRLGFLDGVPGLVHILIGCGASFAKHAKMQAYVRERAARSATRPADAASRLGDDSKLSNDRTKRQNR